MKKFLLAISMISAVLSFSILGHNLILLIVPDETIATFLAFAWSGLTCALGAILGTSLWDKLFHPNSSSQTIQKDNI